MSLNLQFTNNTGLSADSVFITFQVSADQNLFDITYGTAASAINLPKGNLLTDSVSLAEIGSAGLTVNYANSVVVFVSYGIKLASTTSAPAFIGGGTDFNTPFQSFEITMTGNPSDQGNLTAINYFTAPIGISSYSGNTTNPPLQQTGFKTSAQTLGAALDKQASGSAVKVGNTTLRYIGPSSYGASQSNPWPSFVPYLQAVAAANQITKLERNTAFADASQTSYNFTFDFKASAESDGSIKMTGSITTQITEPQHTPKPGPSYDAMTVKIDASSADLYNFVLYGQAGNSCVTWGNWQQLQQYIKEKKLSGAFETLQATLIGEITSGILMGFVNSEYVPKTNNPKNLAVKDMPSSAWWALQPMVAFSALQTQQPYYNTYANQIYLASSNEAYSIPYSDRLGDGPLVNTVNYNGSSVDTWVVDLSKPLAALSID